MEHLNFIFWVGVVEDRQDPLKLGRCRVRIFGHHSENKNLVPTEKLMWAHPLLPVNNTTPYAPKEGDNVIGFYMDGEERQFPVMMGVTPNIPISRKNNKYGFSDPRTTDQIQNSPYKPFEEKTRYPRVLDEPSTPRVARNENIEKSQHQTKRDQQLTPTNITFDDVKNFQAKYPYNRVIETESGHLLELDDTPNKERIHIFHRSGSYFEIFDNGDVVIKSVHDKREVVVKDWNVYIGENATINIDGKATISVADNCKIESGKNIQISAPIGHIEMRAKSISMIAPGGVTIIGGNLIVQKDIISKVAASGALSTPTGEVITIISGTTFGILS